MLEEEKEALRLRHSAIVKTISVEELLPGLFEKRVIPSDDCMERIRNTGATRQDKAIKLLEIVTASDNPRAFVIFVDVLTEYYEFLAQDIKETVHKERRQRRTLPRKNNLELRVDIPQNTNDHPEDIFLNKKVEDCSITEAKKPISRQQSRHSCPESPGCMLCRYPLQTDLSVEAGLQNTCSCVKRYDTHRYSSPEIVHMQCVSELTEVKETYETVDTNLTGARISFPQSSMMRDVSVDEVPTNIFNKQSHNQSTSFFIEHKETSILCNESVNNAVGFDISPEVKCLSTPPASTFQREILCLTETDSVDGFNQMVSGNSFNENFYTKEYFGAQTGHDKNLQTESNNPDDKVANWDEKIENGYKDCRTNNNTKSHTYTKQIWASRAPDYKSNTTPRKYNISPVTQHSHEDNECVDNLKEITLVRSSKSESFGFKFVPGFGEGRARFSGDKDYHITDIIPGSIASKCKDIKLMYTLKSVNGINIEGMKYDNVVRLFDHTTIKLKIKPYPEGNV